jgi:hypothetical protein
MASDFDARLQAVILEVGGMASGGTTVDEKPLIVGKADPFSTIDVYDGTVLLGVVSSNGQGHWSLQLSTPLFDGIHDLSAVQVSGYGVNSTASYFAITVDASEGSQGFGNEDLSFSNAPRHADNAAENGSPYFPANLFNSHAVSPALDNTGIAKDATSVSDPGKDSHNDLQTYVRQVSAHSSGGKGFDIVAFQGDHQVLDLSTLTNQPLSAQTPAIGGFDLGGHHNALVLSLADVLSIGEQDLFIDDGKRQLIVHGKEGDTVDLQNSHVAGLNDGDWHHHGTTQVDGVIYNVVEHSSANTELLVEQPVRIEMH